MNHGNDRGETPVLHAFVSSLLEVCAAGRVPSACPT
jgi:hypothetical protein